MKKIISLTPLVVTASMMLLPYSALAHGHTAFEINEKIYSFVIGSLNEPIAVDDKTGLDLRVSVMSHAMHEMAEMSGTEPEGTPVVGLDKTLKVELIAGDAKRIMDLAPAFGAPGSYRTSFIPTLQTTYSYRIFGTIDNVAFDYTFTCNPAGHPQSPADDTEFKVSDGVTRVESAGAFGCPVARADLGFPEPALTSHDISAHDVYLTGMISSAGMKGLVGIILGAVALGLSLKSMMKKPKGSSKV